MTEGDVLDLIQSAMWTTIVVAGPVVGASMAVGSGDRAVCRR